jgi:hypothetical protein
MSDTYRRDRQKRAFRHLQDSSSDLIDYRSKLVFISILEKHPGWNLSVIKAIADTQAFFVTLFQRPLEWFKEKRMTRKLRRVKCKDSYR